ncbi:MAG: hypothetical protein Tsb0020_41350 [Haliangiales bacterium]
MNATGTAEQLPATEETRAACEPELSALAEDRAEAWEAIEISAQSNPAMMAAHRNRQANLLLERGRGGEARRQYRQALALYREQGSWSGVFDVSNNLALIEADRGDGDDAIATFEELCHSARRDGDRERLACALHNLAWIYKRRGDYERSEALYRDALLCLDALELPAFESNVRNNLGSLARLRGQLETAEHLIQEALEIARHLDDKEAIASRLNNLALVYRDRGQFDEALELLRESLALAEVLCNRRLQAQRLVNIASIVRMRGDLTAARSYLDRAAELHGMIDDPSGRSFVLLRRGSLRLAQGEIELASEDLTQALELLEKRHQTGEVPLARTLLARVFLAQGKVAVAEHVVRHALADLAVLDRPDDELGAWLTLVEIELAQPSATAPRGAAVASAPSSIGVALDRARALAAVYPGTVRRAQVELMAARYFYVRGRSSAAATLADAIRAEAEAADLNEVAMEARLLISTIRRYALRRSERQAGRHELAELVQDARAAGYLRLADEAERGAR